MAFHLFLILSFVESITSQAPSQNRCFTTQNTSHQFTPKISSFLRSVSFAGRWSILEKPQRRPTCRMASEKVDGHTKVSWTLVRWCIGLASNAASAQSIGDFLQSLPSLLTDIWPNQCEQKIVCVCLGRDRRYSNVTKPRKSCMKMMMHWKMPLKTSRSAQKNCSGSMAIIQETCKLCIFPRKQTIASSRRWADLQTYVIIPHRRLWDGNLVGSSWI